MVSELQSKLNTVRVDSADSYPNTPNQHSSYKNSARSSRAATSPYPDSSGSGSASSYDNLDEDLPPPPPEETHHLIMPVVKKPGNENLDVQFDNVLRMMEKLTEEEYLADQRTGPKYAVPFKNKDRPAVPPKPKREMYESLLTNHVTYQVSPVVDVSG